MTLKNNRAPLLCYFKFGALFHSHRSFQAGVTVQKRQIRVKISDFVVPCDLEIWRMTLENRGAPHLTYFKLCASFYSHRSILTVVTVHKRQIQVKGVYFFAPCDLDIWQMILKNNRAPLLCYFKLCVWFHCHTSIQTGVTVRKRLSWVLTSVTLTLTFCMGIISVNGNNSWKFHYDMMMGT